MESEDLNKRVQNVLDTINDFYPIQTVLDKMKLTGDSDLLLYFMNEIQTSFLKEMTERISK